MCVWKVRTPQRVPGLLRQLLILPSLLQIILVCSRTSPGLIVRRTFIPTMPKMHHKSQGYEVRVLKVFSVPFLDSMVRIEKMAVTATFGARQ